jgi:hypothetical protein
LHFTANNKEIDKNGETYNRLWKIREIFGMLNVVYLKFYNPYEHLAIDEATVLFREGCNHALHPAEKQKFQN